MKLALIFLCGVTALACTPPATPPIDGSDGSDCTPALASAQKCPPCACTDAGQDAALDEADQVCAHLNAIGCTMPATCAAAYRLGQGHLTDYSPACLLRASDKVSARTCHSINCP